MDDVETLKSGVLALYDLLGKFERWNNRDGWAGWHIVLTPPEKIHSYEEALKACRKEVSAASKEATRVYLSRNTNDHASQ